MGEYVTTDVVILLIDRLNGRHFSIHDDDDAAHEALVRYVEDHWADAKLPNGTATLDSEGRIDAWMEATQSLYLIGTPSIRM